MALHTPFAVGLGSGTEAFECRAFGDNLVFCTGNPTTIAMNRGASPNRWVALFSLCALASCFGVATAKKCGDRATVLDCGDFKGVLYSVNNSLPPVRVADLTDWQPLDVPDKSLLSVSICNYGNYRVRNSTFRNTTIVPTLVGKVGRWTSVRVNVHNTANLEVTDSLMIGYPVVNVTSNHSTPGADTSVVSKIVMGPVKDGASILVNVSRSANVRLAPSAKQLWLGRATLLNEIINGAHYSPWHCFMDVCFEADLSDSSNVKALGDGATMIIQDGQLDDEAIDTACLGLRSYARVVKRNVSNVAGVKNLTIVDGELSDESVDAHHLFSARVDVQIMNSGNVQAGHVDISEGELIDELVDARDVWDTEISVLAVDSGNVDAHSVSIFEGELIDEAVDVRHFNSSSVVITLQNIGNVRAQGKLSILHGELVDEIMDARGISSGLVDISVVNVSNVQCGSGAANLTESELLETVMDVTNVTHINATVFVSDSANIHVPEKSMYLTNATLAAKTLDFDTLDLYHSGLNVTLTRSEGSGCALCKGYGPSCMIPRNYNATAA